MKIIIDTDKWRVNKVVYVIISYAMSLFYIFLTISVIYFVPYYIGIASEWVINIFYYYPHVERDGGYWSLGVVSILISGIFLSITIALTYPIYNKYFKHKIKDKNNENNY